MGTSKCSQGDSAATVQFTSLGFRCALSSLPARMLSDPRPLHYTNKGPGRDLSYVHSRVDWVIQSAHQESE